MSASGGPDLITNNLVFHVDASNPRCYSGGSICRDLTNINGNGTITNVSLSSDKAFLMNATTSSVSFVKKVNLASNFTYSVAFYVDNLTPQDGLCLLSSFNNIYGGMGLAVYDSIPVLGIWDAYSDNLDAGDELVAPFDGTSANFSRKIRILTGTYNGTTITIYLNGNKVDSRVSPATISDQTYIDIGFAHGAFWTNNVTAAGTKIYQASVYNRALTDGEILQNYNSLKTRYRI
jgi:hypothetical protein